MVGPIRNVLPRGFGHPNGEEFVAVGVAMRTETHTSLIAPLNLIDNICRLKRAGLCLERPVAREKIANP